MTRAARFCNFDSLLIFVEDVDPHVTRHLVGKRTAQKTPSKTPPATAR